MMTPRPDPEELLGFTSEGGRILYGDERRLLLSAEALGKLRQELYEVLGPVMAHEVLFRFGFHDGARTARVLRDRMENPRPRELLRAGPLVHNLEGMASARVDELDCDDEFRRMTGSWEDSVEADQSLALLGPVDWSSCWILTGFASGFASEAVGESLLCVETACRAQGAETCRFEITRADRFPGLARKVEALRGGLRLTDRMKPTMTRLWEQAYASSAYLARILKDSADAILTVDENEIVRSWNRGAEELLGYRAEEVVGKHFRFMVPEDLLLQGEIEKVRSVASQEGSLRNYETRRLKKNGEEVYVSLTRTSIYDAHGRYVGASAILRDITERKRMVEQLIQVEALAEVGEMAAQIAHEIKNPLAGISGAIQVIAESTPKTDPKSEIYAEILNHIRRLDETVLSLLSYTKPFRPSRVTTDLGLVLDSAVKLLRGSHELSEVRIEIEHSPEVGAVSVDAQQLSQVVMNLLLNAVHSLRDDKRVTVATGVEGDGVWIRVVDRGAGMTPEIRRQVLKPFFTTKHKGTGLGLPIAQKIVAAHGGTIRIESAPGVGTTVTILLPRA
jgi:PAS domain S-box-containing protein